MAGSVVGIFVPPLAPWESWKSRWGFIRKPCAEQGHKPNIVLHPSVYLDDDEKQIRKEVEGALTIPWRSMPRR